MIALLLAAALMTQPDTPSLYNDALTPPPERWLAYRVGEDVIAFDANQTPERPPEGIVALASLLWSPGGIAEPRARFAEVIHRIDCAASGIGLSETTRFDAGGRMIDHTAVAPLASLSPQAGEASLILFRAVCGGAQPDSLFEASSREAVLERLEREARP